MRYDGRPGTFSHPLLDRWLKEDRLIRCCPETDGGLPVPRAAAEIRNREGNTVFDGSSLVVTADGTDVSEAFIRGANIALQLVEKHMIRFALLKANSPSCGNDQIYDGRFNCTLVPGQGVTATLLRQHGVSVYNEHQIEQLAARLLQYENRQTKR